NVDSPSPVRCPPLVVRSSRFIWTIPIPLPRGPVGSHRAQPRHDTRPVWQRSRMRRCRRTDAPYRRETERDPAIVGSRRTPLFESPEPGLTRPRGPARSPCLLVVGRSARPSRRALAGDLADLILRPLLALDFHIEVPVLADDAAQITQAEED